MTIKVAEHVIRKVGGIAKVAALLGLGTLAVRRWAYDSDKGGRGGQIPMVHASQLLKLSLSPETNFALTPDDFFEETLVQQCRAAGDKNDHRGTTDACI